MICGTVPSSVHAWMPPATAATWSQAAAHSKLLPRQRGRRDRRWSCATTVEHAATVTMQIADAYIDFIFADKQTINQNTFSWDWGLRPWPVTPRYDPVHSAGSSHFNEICSNEDDDEDEDDEDEDADVETDVVLDVELRVAVTQPLDDCCVSCARRHVQRCLARLHTDHHDHHHHHYHHHYNSGPSPSSAAAPSSFIQKTSWTSKVITKTK